MKLAQTQRKQLHQALLDAFINESELAQMISFELDENLEAIAGKGSLSSIIFNLIRWAEAQGRTEELVKGALAQNPRNSSLQKFAQQFGLSDSQSPSDYQSGESQDPLIDVKSRIQLSKLLSALPSPQFNELLFGLTALNLPQGNLPSISAAQADRVTALLNWADSPIGCGLDQLQSVLQSVIDSHS